jgi:hypothetical protein
MDAADALAAWGLHLHEDGADKLERWETPTTPQAVPAAPLKRGERLSVYWTELDQWYTGTFTTSCVEAADGGGKQRSSCIVYDATGAWATCTKRQLTYWHCLDDEQWSGEVE